MSTAAEGNVESVDALRLDAEATPTASAGLRSAGIYAVGGTLPRALGLITLPVFTHVISPTEYGKFSLLVTIATAVAILFSLGLDVAVFRIYFQLSGEPYRQQRFVNSVWLVLLIVPLTGALTIGLVAWPFLENSARFGGADLTLALLASASAVAATTAPLSLLRAERRLQDFLIVTTVATLASTGLTLVFVVGFRFGIRGWLLAVILANILTFATASIVVPFRLARPIDWSLIAESLRFGAPLVPHAISYWALQVADRIVIAGMVSSSALGVYSLASNLGAPVLMLVQSLNFGFMPTYARAGAGHGNRTELDEAVVMQATIVVFICATCASLAPPFVSIVTPSTYGQAASLIPWIALGYGFLGLYMIPMNGISLGGGRTKFVSIATLTAVSTNLGLLYLFVPTGGIRAAAIASAVAYAVLLVAVFIYASRPENPVRYRWGLLSLVFTVVGAAYVAGAVTSDSTGGLTSLLVRAAWLALAFLVIIAARKRTRSFLHIGT